MARSISQANGSTLLGYEHGKTAFLVLPSKEQVVISIGTGTVKVFTRRLVLGWVFPRTIALQHIAYWEPSFAGLDRLRRFACGCMVLDGLIDLVSRCRSISELRLAWTVLRNPLEVAVSQTLKA